MISDSTLSMPVLYMLLRVTDVICKMDEKINLEKRTSEVQYETAP